MSTTEAAAEEKPAAPGPPPGGAAAAAAPSPAGLAEAAGAADDEQESEGPAGAAAEPRSGDGAPSAGGEQQPPGAEGGEAAAAAGGREDQPQPQPQPQQQQQEQEQQQQQQQQPPRAQQPSYFAQLAGCLAPGGGGAASAPGLLPGLLHDGACLIGSLCDGRPSPLGGAVPPVGPDGRRAPPPADAALDPASAALYLYAVGRAADSLGSAVLGGPASPSSPFGVEHVARIVSAASVAAAHCSSRSAICRTGIIPALAGLVECTSAVAPAPLGRSAAASSSSGGRAPSTRGVSVDRGRPLRTLTPFHADVLQICLLAGQYRYASSFLSSCLPGGGRTVVEFPHGRLDHSSFLRAYYYAGLVHAGCEDWQSALTAFHACLVLPSGAASALQVAARKKMLLVRCLLLESDELDSVAAGGPGTGGGGQSRRSGSAALEDRVLGVPGACGPSLAKLMSAQTGRVAPSAAGGGHPERAVGAADAAPDGGAAAAAAGGEATSEQRQQQRTAGGGGPQRVQRKKRGGDDGPGGDGGGRGQGPGVAAQLARYHELVSTYLSGNAGHFARLLGEMAGTLRSDGNQGLARHLVGRLGYRAVRRVASVYSVAGLDALSGRLSDLIAEMGGSASSGAGHAVGVAGVEDLVLGMAAADSSDPLVVDPFAARVDQSTGTVAFALYEDDDDGDEWDSASADLASRLGSCVALAQRVRDLDVRLSTSPAYQRHAVREAAIRGDARAAASSVADLGGGPGAMDIGGMEVW